MLKQWLTATIVFATLTGCASNLPRSGSGPAPAPGWTAADSASAHAAALRFLTAFDSLQWDRFTSSFAEDVTVFLPFPDRAARVDGRAAVEAAFSEFFASVREGGRPTLGIVPRAVRVQLAGADVAIVTFELGTSAPSRRTVVFSRTGTPDWKVVHWHASSPPLPPAPAGPGVPLPKEQLATYEGTYDLNVGGRTLQLRVVEEEGQLKVQLSGQGATPLSYRGGHEFVLQTDGSIRLVFAVNAGSATGLTLHQGGGVFQGVRR